MTLQRVRRSAPRRDRSSGLAHPGPAGAWSGACLQAASPLAFFWLDDATVYALGLVLIAAVYIGFGVADGRARSSPSRPASPPLRRPRRGGGDRSAWLIVAGLAAHGVKDLWQHRTRFVANTRWWPPFCATIDWVAAAILAAAIAIGADLG